MQIIAQNFINVAIDLNIEHSLIILDNWGSGLSFYDINNDGWDDITLLLENDTQVILINNNGTFEPLPNKIYNEGNTKYLIHICMKIVNP